MTRLSSIFSSRTLHASLLPGKAVWFALALVAACELALRAVPPDLGYYEGASSLEEWVRCLERDIAGGKPPRWLLGNSVLAYGVDAPRLARGSGAGCAALPFGGATFAGETAMGEHFLRRAPAEPEEIVFCVTKDDFNANGERAETSGRYLAYDTWRGLTLNRLLRLASARNTLMNTAKRLLFGRDAASARNPSEPSFGGVIPPEKLDLMTRLMQDYAFDGTAFDRLAADAAANGFRVRVVLVPVSRAYLDFHDRARPDLPVDAISERIARECAARGFAFHDFSRAFPDDDACFMDPYHLTEAGRNRFTDLLARTLAPEGFAPPRVLRVACVGDSITRGAPAVQRGGRPWPDLLAELAQGALETGNFGVDGTTLAARSGRAWRDTAAFGQALDFAPDIVVVAFGVNDLAHPDLLGGFADDGVELCNAFRERNPDVRFCLCTPTPLAPAKREREANAALRDIVSPAVREIARRTGGEVVDVFSAFPATLQRLPDGTHPDPIGNVLIAKRVWAALEGATSAP